MQLVLKTASVVLMAVLAGQAAPVADAQQDAVRTVEIHAKRFAFSPAEITLPVGKPVTLALTSDDVAHSLLIEGLGVNAPMNKGKVTRVTVTPSHVGDFKGRCGHFCGTGHGTMTFTVHVVDR